MKKGLSMLLIALAGALCLSGCGKGNGEETISGDTVTTSVTEETTGVQATPLSVVANGKTVYKVIRSDDASDTVMQASLTLRAAINEAYGVELGIGTDFEKRGTDPSTRYAYEILVGETNRDESAEAKELIRYQDTIIAVMGSRVVISGGSDEAVAEAVDYFIEHYVGGTELLLDGELRDICEGQYAKASLTLDGVDISEYTIVYASKYKNAALEVAARIGQSCGTFMTVVNDSAEQVEREIVIGSTKHGCEMTGMEYDSFNVAVRGKSIYISGGAVTSVETGCARLLDLLVDSEATAVALADTAVTYTLPDRSEYINDISKLALNWELYFETPEWMLDYEEKYAAMQDVDGRIMSCLHRGDMQDYPENSIEGYISAIRMGADMIEIDPHLTKDGVFVLIHDDTLTRTTNFSDMAGKNGLPTSPYVKDWTYEQLMQLNLKEGTGGTSARVTKFKIPTLDETFQVCANRIFIRLDVKADSNGKIYWDYEEDIWPLMVKHKSYTNVIYTWHAAFYSNSYALVKEYKALQTQLCGKSAFHFIGCSASKSAADILSTIKLGTDRFDPCVRLTDFDLSKVSCKSYLETNAKKLASFKGKVRLYVEAHGTNSAFDENKEGAALYEMLNEAGINILLVNKGYTLCTYIAENFEAPAY